MNLQKSLLNLIDSLSTQDSQLFFTVVGQTEGLAASQCAYYPS